MQEIQEMQVQSLGWEDPLEEGMSTHSSILAWKIPWTEEPGGLQSMGSQRVAHGWSSLAHLPTPPLTKAFICFHHVMGYTAIIPEWGLCRLVGYKLPKGRDHIT